MKVRAFFLIYKKIHAKESPLCLLSGKLFGSGDNSCELCSQCKCHITLFIKLNLLSRRGWAATWPTCFSLLIFSSRYLEWCKENKSSNICNRTMKVCIWFLSHDIHSFEDSQLLIMEKIRNLYFYKNAR